MEHAFEFLDLCQKPVLYSGLIYVSIFKPISSCINYHNIIMKFWKQMHLNFVPLFQSSGYSRWILEFLIKFYLPPLPQKGKKTENRFRIGSALNKHTNLGKIVMHN